MKESQESIEVMVECPNCKKTKLITVPKYLFSNKKMGTLKVQVHSGICCEHEFIAFVSNNGKVRGYESIDMALDLSKVEKAAVEGKIFLRDLIATYGDYAISSCLHAILCNFPIIFLRSSLEKSKTALISHLLNEFLPDVYKQTLVQVSTIIESEYQESHIGDCLVISPGGVVAHSPWQDIPLKLEKELLTDALGILDDESQTVVMQQELGKIFEHAEFIIKKIEKKEIYEEDLMKDFKKEFKKPLNEAYLNLLKQVIEYRYKKDVSRIKIRSFDTLKEGLW
ncbi:MAG: hypothetical protein ACTSWC_03580 [Promethearchaeota archaeon]